MTKPQYKTEILTGIRPSADLTVANYLGAVEPILELQKKHRPYVFVADLHALTDKEPAIAQKYIQEVVADYLALGLDPKKVVIYTQSSIAPQIQALTFLLARHTTAAELLRVPTLKDKIKKGQSEETANALLLLYPVMMAADILIQRAKFVPVGEDQLAHIEITRKLARRFNKQYANIFPEPKPLDVKAIRILSLKGEGKMSKSNPNGAIFLTDTPKEAAAKIKKAQTAEEGKMNDYLQSHILLAKGLAQSKEQKNQIDEIISEHKNGKQVMGEFKKLFEGITVAFLEKFQAKRAEVTVDKHYIPSLLEEGGREAAQNADETLALVQNALYKI